MTVRTIGQLADSVGVGVETIRYYERRGLLDPPPRTASGYRQYGDADRWRLDFILRAKDLGFTLAEIGALLAGPERRPADVLAVARQRLAAVQAEIDERMAVQARLRQLVRTCADGRSDADCTSLGAVAQTSTSAHASSR